MKKFNKTLILSCYDLFLFFISLLGVCNIFLLAIKKFYPIISIIISLTIFIVAIIILKKLKYSFELFRVDKLTFLILLLAFLVRFPVSLYLMGGQDQGTYLNISKQYEINHKLYVVDEFRETLTKAQQEIYDKYGNYIMPSIEKWNRPDSEYSMVFYPMHPSFMSIFSLLFGSDNRAYTITMFSIIVILNIYLIVYELTGNKQMSLVALILMSINPVFLFFSKFPVGEVTALAFSSSGFYFLLKFLNNKTIQFKNIIFLFFSTISFFCFMFVRMTFVIYLPILGLILLYLFLFEKERISKLIFLIYFIFNIFLLTFSYFYYKTLLFPLYNLIFSRGIKGVIIKFILVNKNWFTLLAILIFIIFYLIKRKIIKIDRGDISKINNFLVLILGALSMGIFALVIDRARSEYFYLNNTISVVYLRWNLLNRGLDGIKHVPFFSILNYISFFGFIIFLIFFTKNLLNIRNLKYAFLFFIVFYFLFITNYRFGFMRYDYYNSRYYLTEVIPIFMIVISISFVELLQKRKMIKNLAIVLFSLMSLYFLIFSLLQLNRYEGPDPLFFKYLNSKISDNSLLIFVNQNIYESKYESNYNLYVAGPLKYYYGKKLVVIDSIVTLEDPNLQDLISRFNKVYYFSNIPLISNRFTKEEILQLNYYHFNNSPNCNYHNYEFLDIEDTQQIDVGNYLNCKLLPNTYYTRIRDYYFGEYKNI